MRILLFGGTTEGRTLAEAIALSENTCHVCVATDYGASLLPKDERLIVHKERMDEKRMEALINETGFDVCIDATHPYATEASANIGKACEAAGLKLYRIKRDDVSIGDNCTCFENIKQAVGYLAGKVGNILITTGSKELGEYTLIDGFDSRCFVRVLPSAEVINECISLGFKQKNLICMQGPFDYDLNTAMLRACNAKYLVTKASGNEGGFLQKCRAAADTGAELIVIGRPPEEGTGAYSLPEIADILGLTGSIEPYDSDGKRHAYIIGMGCGNLGQLTMDAINAILKSECIIGARRLLDVLKEAAECSHIYGIPAGRLTEGKALIAEYDKAGIAKYLKEIKPQSAAILFSGDIGFYSGASGIEGVLEGYETVRIPGISSGVYLCDKLMIPWQDVRFLSCHGRNPDILCELEGTDKLLILLGSDHDAADICRLLSDNGFKDAKVYIGENLSYDDEKMISDTAKALTDVVTSPLAVMLIVKDD